MKSKLLFLIVLQFCACSIAIAQNKAGEEKFFNAAYYEGLADKMKLGPVEKQEFIEGHRKNFFQDREVDEHGHPHISPDEYIWVKEPGSKYSNNSTLAGPCTNIDFEQGNMTGWVRSTGFNPLFNAAGCCGTANGDQTIMTGTGIDPYGGFPVVYPGGGNFSLRLGSTAVGGRADRIEQTFFVTQANANFTYRYAVVLNHGGTSHSLVQQPRFDIEMIDTLGNQVPCTYYQVSAGTNLAGYSTSSLTANGTAVVYKPWTSVIIDLTPNIGQNVTLRFTVYDCGPSGHFAYAYIDGLCTNFDLARNDTTCPNIPAQLCAPTGFLTYNWAGPNSSTYTTSCINVTAPGTYTCSTVLIPGCPGPTFTRTLTLYNNPILSFTPSTGVCSPQFTFNSTSSIAVGTITSHEWRFGDLNTNTVSLNPVHTYTAPGAYNVKLRGFTNMGCRDSVTQTVYVHPPPVVAFSPPSHCINTQVQFTNTSFVPAVTGVPAGSIVAMTWTLGPGLTSTVSNPVYTYSSSGTFPVGLTVTSDQGCVSAAMGTLGIFPPPQLDFLADPLCDINGTTFSPLTNTAIASGSIVSYFWNFGDGGTSTQANPVHIYAGPGIYNIKYKGTSNHSCVDSVVKTLTISPTPTINFSRTTPHQCSNQFSFTNTSNGVGPLTYTWTFGGANSSNLTNPTFSFTGPGTYTVMLIGKTNMGCADTSVQNITIFPFPTVSVGMPGACENAVVNPTVTISSGTVSAFSWNFDDPASGAANTSTLQNPSHSYSLHGVYTTSLNMTSAEGCPMAVTTSVQIHPNPTVNFFDSRSDACSTSIPFIGNPTSFTVPGNSYTSTVWDFNGMGSSTSNSVSFNFISPGQYSVSFTASSNNGCSAAVTKTFVIYPYAQASVNVNPSCLNVGSVFNASIDIAPVPASTIVSTSWAFGNGSTLNVSPASPSANFSFANLGPFQSTFTAITDQGCVTTRTANVIIHPVPQVTFDFVIPCENTLVTFTNNSTGNITGYDWTFGDGSPQTQLVNPGHTYTAAGLYTVELKASTGFGCVDSLQKTLQVNPNPTAILFSHNVCEGSAITFTGSQSLPGNNGQITSLIWNLGDGTQPLQAFDPSHTYASTNTYTVLLTASNNFSCTHTTQTVVTVYPKPVVSFTAAEVCQGSTTQYTNTSSIVQGSLSYVWNFGEPSSGISNTSVFENPQHTYASSGSFQVALTAMSDHNCSNTITRNVVVHATPLANFSSTTICAGDQVTFLNLSSAIDGTIVSSQWDFNGDDIVDQIVTNPKMTFSVNGNFFVKLTVASEYGCLHSITKPLVVNPKPIPVFTTDNVSGCPELCVTFNNVSHIASGSVTSIRWDFGDGSPISNVSSPKHCYEAGNYDVTLEVRSDLGCVSRLISSNHINVFPKPVANFMVTPEEVDEDEPTIQIRSTASSDVINTRFYLSDGATYTSTDFSHTVKNLHLKQKPMIVQVVKNIHGCVDTLYKVLDIKPAFSLYVPNVFTPNLDGRNDEFLAKGVGITKFSMQIYDRWGHEIFRTNDMTKGWDGTIKGSFEPAKQDTYIWKAQVTDIFFELHELVGHVTLLK